MVEKTKIKDFPDSPGVYIMKDAWGEIVYVGKARSLKKRVASYFSNQPKPLKTEVLMSYVRDIVYEELPGEHEAFLREAELIKKLQPRFNISLKDDKSYPYIIVTHEEFPRVCIGRRPKKKEENADFFGPYTSARLLRQALRILRRSFPFCSCRRFPVKPCLNYDLKLCLGPCKDKAGRKACRRRYLRSIRSLEDFLTKKSSVLIEDLSLRLRKLVRQERFEQAAAVRDQLEALSMLVSLKKNLAEAMREQDDWKKIGLKDEPKRVEAFDISNLGGGEAVGSMVSFFEGAPDKDNYRRFRIRSVEGIDDYAMIREVVGRRYRRLIEENKAMPDLIVIDGGAGHLAAAKAVLDGLQVTAPVISIAKEEEMIYTPVKRLPVRLERSSSALRNIQAVRNEAHRFAVKYHHLLRKKKTFGEE